MQRTAASYATRSQASLYLGLLLCFVLMPHYLLERNEGGVSNYGVHALTILPYTVAFGLSSWYMFKAAARVPADRPIAALTKRLLQLIAALWLLVLVSTYPYKLNPVFHHVHILSGMLLFAAELLVGGWLAVRWKPSAAGSALLFVQIAGSVLALLTLRGRVHLLFVAQLMTGLAFGGLVIQSLRD